MLTNPNATTSNGYKTPNSPKVFSALYTVTLCDLQE